MFDSKKTNLFSPKKEDKKTTSASVPAFVQAGLKKKAEVLSGNGALKYSTTGNPFVDQFGKLGEYKKPRSFAEIAKDCETLWAEDPLDSVKMAFYIRMISRSASVPGFGSPITQRGAELKHEGIMRMIWTFTKDKKAFMNNLPLIPVVGSWKDIITMLQYDLVYNGWSKRVLPWDFIGLFILSALRDNSQRELLKKYLPSIQANSRCKTVEAQADNIIGKWICGLLYPAYKGSESTDEEHAKYQALYRKMKSAGTAHEWQKLISRRKLEEIDFAKIHGRALSLLVRSKFLKKHKLQDKYAAWIKKPTTKDVKYTGFVHELFEEMLGGGLSVKYTSLSSIPEHIQMTINKQFETLVKKGMGAEIPVSSLIVVRDTSSSMGSIANGTKVSCHGIAKALALYFSEFLRGKFANSWIEFNSDAQMHTWKGKTPLERWFNDRSGYYGSTDFQSVIELFCRIKHSGIPESEFPVGILCISDGEFNSTSLSQTNVETARKSLRSAGFSKEYCENFVICLWNLQSKYYGDNTGSKFETYGDARNVYYFSGYSASVVAFLTGEKVKTAADVVEAALNQEILQLIKI